MRFNGKEQNNTLCSSETQVSLTKGTDACMHLQKNSFKWDTGSMTKGTDACMHLDKDSFKFVFTLRWDTWSMTKGTDSYVHLQKDSFESVFMLKWDTVSMTKGTDTCMHLNVGLGVYDEWYVQHDTNIHAGINMKITTKEILNGESYVSNLLKV